MHEAAAEYDNAVRMLGGTAHKKGSVEQTGLEASLLDELRTVIRNIRK